VSYVPAGHGLNSGPEGVVHGSDLGAAQTLFRRFHRFSAPRVERVACGRTIPRVLVHLGYLKAVIYSSDRGDPGRPKTYIHFMETPPRLTCDPDGRQLYVVGGRYRVTRRGIEG
jgi:hypothetical protein